MRASYRFAPLMVGVFSLTNVQALARDGSLDNSFGVRGKTLFQPPSGQFLGTYNTEIGQQSVAGGLIVAAPVLSAAGATDFGVMRLLPNGSIDSSFGSGGVSIVAFDRTNTPASDSDDLAGLALQPDAKIVLLGNVAGDSSTNSDFGVVRLTADGALDPSFGSGGKTVVPFNIGLAGHRRDTPTRIDLQSDGKMLLIGSAEIDDKSNGAMAITRLTQSGTRETSFDLDGRVTVNFGGDSAVGYRVRQLTDGGILAVGGAYTVPGALDADFALAKFTESGALDPSFGIGGKVTYGFQVGGDFVDIATDFVENPDGTLMVCGRVQANAPTNYDMGCERFLANGKPDPTFTPALVIFDRGGNLYDAPLRLEHDPQGRFLLAGINARDVNNSDFALARLLPNGQLDQSFGNGGQMTYGSVLLLGVDRDNGASGMVIQSGGQILLAGHAASKSPSTYQYSDYEFQVMRVIGDTIFASGSEP